MISLAFIVIFFIFSGTIGLHLKNEKFKFFLGLLLCVVYALFWSQQVFGRGVDIDRYREAFIAVPLIYESSSATTYGYVYSGIMSVFKTFGLGFRFFLFFIHFLCNFLVLFSFRLLCKNYIFAFSSFLLFSDTLISMIRVQRQGFAVALCFLAVSLFVVNRRKLSFVILPLAASVHLTFFPVYLFVVSLYLSFKNSVFLGRCFLLVCFLGLMLLVSNIDFIPKFLSFLGYDGKYYFRAITYLGDSTDELDLGAGFALIVGVSIFAYLSNFYSKKKLSDSGDLGRLISLIIIFFVSFTFFVSDFGVFSRMSLYFSPFYALALAFAMERYSGQNKNLLGFGLLLILGSFFWLRVLLRDADRIPFI